MRLDVLKALAIVLVVFGHSVSRIYDDPAHAPVWIAWAFTALSAFHVPLFMFVAGYVTRRAPNLSWLRDRALRLLVPYAAWGCVQYVAYFRGQGPAWFGRAAIDPAATNALWFLYVLFGCCLVLWATARTPGLTLAVAVACVVMPQYVPVFGGQQVQLMFPFFAAGWLLRERRVTGSPVWFGFAALFALLLVTEPGVSPLWSSPAWVEGLKSALPEAVRGTAALPLRIARVGLALSLCFGLLWVAGLGVRAMGRRATSAVAAFGTLSLGIYCVHPFFMPTYIQGPGGRAVLTAFAIDLIMAVGAAWLIGRGPLSSFLFLGAGWQTVAASESPARRRTARPAVRPSVRPAGQRVRDAGAPAFRPPRAPAAAEGSGVAEVA